MNVYKVPAPAGKVSLTMSEVNAQKLRDAEYRLGNRGVSTSASAIVHHALARMSADDIVAMVEKLAVSK